MWLTAVISYPIAWLLDGLGASRKDDLGIFTNEQLAVIIKHHEKSQKRGGNLSPDSTRIILAVLNMEGREVGGEIANIPRGSDDFSKDVEKGRVEITRGVIVKWSSVKTVNMDEIVDKAFIDKVIRWSYSRIPVVGLQAAGDSSVSTRGTEWDGTQVFGFLHIKVKLLNSFIENC